MRIPIVLNFGTIWSIKIRAAVLPLDSAIVVADTTIQKSNDIDGDVRMRRPNRFERNFLLALTLVVRRTDNPQSNKNMITLTRGGETHGYPKTASRLSS